MFVAFVLDFQGSSGAVEKKSPYNRYICCKGKKRKQTEGEAKASLPNCSDYFVRIPNCESYLLSETQPQDSALHSNADHRW